MTLLPLNDRIKVQRIADPNAPKHLIYAMPETAPTGPQYARVVAVPASGELDDVMDFIEPSLPIKQGVAVGSIVVLGAGCGICIPEDGQDYYYVLPGDFLAVVG